jgi:hypothetical protein
MYSKLVYPAMALRREEMGNDAEAKEKEIAGGIQKEWIINSQNLVNQLDNNPGMFIRTFVLFRNV